MYARTIRRECEYEVQLMRAEHSRAFFADDVRYQAALRAEGLFLKDGTPVDTSAGAEARLDHTLMDGRILATADVEDDGAPVLRSADLADGGLGKTSPTECALDGGSADALPGSETCRLSFTTTSGRDSSTPEDYYKAYGWRVLMGAPSDATSAPTGTGAPWSYRRNLDEDASITDFEEPRRPILPASHRGGGGTGPARVLVRGWRMTVKDVQEANDGRLKGLGDLLSVDAVQQLSVSNSVSLQAVFP